MRRLLLIGLIVGLVLPASIAVGQEDLRIDELDTTDYPTVSLIVTAPSSLVEIDLSDAFVVEENGEVRPSEATQLTSEPLEVLLLVDTSGSMRGVPIQSAIKAAGQFAERMPTTTRMAVIGFGSTVSEVQGFTDDPALVVEALSSLTATGETALFDGLLAAAESFDITHAARRFIVLLSDGGDTASTVELGAVAAAFRETGVGLYAIELATPESDPEALVALTGRVVPVTDTEGLAGVYEEIADELVSQYRITYDSSAHDDTAIRISAVHGDVITTTTATIALPPVPAAPTTTTTAVVATPTTVASAVTDVLVLDDPTPFIGAGPGFLGSFAAFLIGAIALFLALTLFLVPAMATGTNRYRAFGPTRASSPGSVGSAMAAVTGRAESIAAKLLRKRGKEGALNHALDSAGVTLRPGEFLVAIGSISLISFVIGAMLGGWGLGLVLGICGLLVPWAWLRIRTDKRREAFADQLEGTLQLIAGSLRAGYGLMQSVNTVAAESPSPTAEEFERVVMETRLGRDLIDSLNALTGRVANEDFGWIVQAIQIQRDVGGDLAELLDTITSTIRDRHQVHRQVRALSAEGRLSAVILILLPFGLAGVILVTSPGYLTVLVTHTTGKVLIAIGGILMVIGAVWIRRVIRLVF